MEHRLAAEAKFREEAEQTLERERKSFQMAALASGSGLLLFFQELSFSCVHSTSGLLLFFQEHSIK